MIVQLRDGPERPLADHGPADHVGEGQDVLLDLGREAAHAHDLGDAGAGDALPAGDGRLVGDLAGLEEALPLDGLAEELDTRGVRGSFGGLGLPRGGGTAETTASAGTRRVRVPTLPFSKAPLGPRAISTVCSR